MFKQKEDDLWMNVKPKLGVDVFPSPKLGPSWALVF